MRHASGIQSESIPNPSSNGIIGDTGCSHASQSLRVKDCTWLSSESESDVPVLFFRAAYFFRGPCFCRLVVAAHHKATASSALKSSSLGPSAFISMRSERVWVLRPVRRSVFMIFKVENSRSTWVVANGRLNTSRQSRSKLGYLQ